MTSPNPKSLVRWMPPVFVLIWSTGFIVARYGMPSAPPFTFLMIRYALSVAAFLAWVGLVKAPWPREPRQWLHLAVTGVLMHAVYLGGVWAAVKGGMGAGVAALVVGLQPLLTAVWVAWGGSQVSRVQWIGVVLGLFGLVLVVWQRLGIGEVTVFNMAFALMALGAITVGTLYQKRFLQPADFRTASLIQLSAAFLVSLPFAASEAESVRWGLPGNGPNWELIGAMGWSVIGLTLGASSLLYLLIQRGAAMAVTSMFYLVPPTTVLMAWLLFGEPVTLISIVGIVLAALGVRLVVRTAGAASELSAVAKVSGGERTVRDN